MNEELTEEIEALVAKARQSDEEEDQECREKTGYEIPGELKIKEKRLAKIQAAKEALEKREKEIAPDQEIEDKKQIILHAVGMSDFGPPKLLS